MKSLKYFWYIIRHKFFVFKAGLKTGAPIWLLLIHDWSKFLPNEFTAYADFFGTPEEQRTSTQRALFTKAWERHLARNPHHWNYWVQDSRAMPECYVREMVADWMGAGRAITGRWEVVEWYEQNKTKMWLHDHTRSRVEQLIDAVG